MTRTLISRPALALAALLMAAPAAAQSSYVYGATYLGFFRNEHFTDMPPRLVTIDPIAGEAIASLDLPFCEPTGVATRHDGHRVFVSCAGAPGRVIAIDPVAKQIVGVRTVDASAGGVAVTPAGDRLVVPRIGLPTLVLDATSLSTVGTIPGTGTAFFNNSRRVVVSNDGATAYFTEELEAGGRIVVASLADFSVTTTISFSADRFADIALNADGTRLVVGHQDAKLSIVDTATHGVVATVVLSGHMSGRSGVAVDSSGRVHFSRVSGVQVIDLASKTLVGELPLLNAGPLAINASRDRLYVNAASTVATVNTANGTVLSSAPFKGVLRDLAAASASPAITPDTCTYRTAFRAGSFSFGPPRESPAGSTHWRIDVIALPDRCPWTAQSNVPWIALQFASGTGPDNVGFTIAPNTTGQPRTGTITIAGQSMTITQAGCTNPIVFFERPIANTNVSQPFRVSGWAIDTCSGSGTGLSDASGSVGYGRPRPDVAAAFGPQFVNSGFEFVSGERPPGAQDITISFRDEITGAHVNGAVRVNVLPSSAPIGAIDTPVEGAVVSGDMPLTGWALDDVRLFGSVMIFRDALPGEPSSAHTPGKVFIGVATRVAGVRPDVQAIFPNHHESDRAGFGAMILTNALPNGGNGTFTFWAQVVDGLHVTWLGPRTVTVDNANSPLPFGAIDTPGPGQTVNGTILVQGWALTPGDAMIPVDGSTIDVVIDGVVVGHPTYNQARPDVQALFPAYTNAAAPGAYLAIDTTTLANGLHTIAWVVRDNKGNAKGIGSRYFTVNNP